MVGLRAPEFLRKRARYFRGLRSKSSYQTVPKIGQTGLLGQEFRSIFTLTASVFASVLKEREIRCQLVLPLGAADEAANPDSSAALNIATDGVSALSSLSVFK